MTTGSITLTARQLRELVNPVLPFTNKDDMLPVLCAVHFRTDGKWLIATATDRFRIAVKRIAKFPTEGDEATEWPALEMLVPLRAVQSILAMSKPTRSFDPALTLTVDGDRLTVEMAGGFDLFDSGRFVHQIETADFPNVRELLAKELATPEVDCSPVGAFNPAFLADFAKVGGGFGGAGLRVRMGAPGKPLLVMDDDGFLGLLMPRRVERDAESWEDVLAEKPAPKKAARKATAKAGAA